MYGGYYQPYWTEPDELEHYGVKGMRWGKKRETKSLAGQSFFDTKTIDTVAWFKANPGVIGDLSSFFDRPTPRKTTDNTIKRKLSNIRKSLRSVFTTPIGKIRQTTVNKGSKVIQNTNKRKKI